MSYPNVMGTVAPCHLPGNVICAAVGLVHINLQPEYELPRTIPKVWKHFIWGQCAPTIPKEKCVHEVRVLVHILLARQT